MTVLALGVEIDAIELSNDAAEVREGLRSVWVNGIELQSKKFEGMSNQALSLFSLLFWSEAGSKLGLIEAESDGIEDWGNIYEFWIEAADFWSTTSGKEEFTLAFFFSFFLL